MRVSLDISLKRLRTDYVDIFYVHAWDMHTSVEEIMDGLHNLVAAGKILYLVGTSSLFTLLSYLPTGHIKCPCLACGEGQ